MNFVCDVLCIHTSLYLYQECNSVDIHMLYSLILPLIEADIAAGSNSYALSRIKVKCRGASLHAPKKFNIRTSMYFMGVSLLSFYL